MRRLIRSVYEIKWAIVNQIILSIGAFGTIVVLSRFLNRDIFGEIRYIAAVLAILSFFSLPGASSIVIQSASAIGKKRVVQIITNQLQWGLIATAGALFFALFYFLKGNMGLGYGFLVGGFFAPIANLYQMPGYILAGLKSFKSKTLVDSVILSAIIMGAIFGTLLTRNVPGTLLFYFGIQSIATLVLLFYTIKKIPSNTTTDTTETLDITHSKQLSVFQAPFTLLPALEKIFIFLLLGPSSLAIFTIAVLPLEHMRSAFRSLLQFSVLPHFEDESKATLSLKKWLATTSILTIGGIIVLIVFTKIILPIFFPQYIEAIPYGFILILALIPVPLQILTLALIASRKIRDLFIYAGSLTIVNVVTFLALIPLFGLMGAVIAKIITEFLTAILLVIFYKNSEN
ncbi:MAG: hypothetical protein Q7T49_00310 [bacterium]|nr:hypothetical protein [bacterium]